MQREFHIIDLQKVASKRLKQHGYGDAPIEEVPDCWPCSVWGVDDKLIYDTMNEFNCTVTLHRRFYTSAQECWRTLREGEFKLIAIYRCEYQGMIIGYIHLTLDCNCGFSIHMCSRPNRWSDLFNLDKVGVKGLSYERIALYLTKYGFDPTEHLVGGVSRR